MSDDCKLVVILIGLYEIPVRYQFNLPLPKVYLFPSKSVDDILNTLNDRITGLETNDNVARYIIQTLYKYYNNDIKSLTLYTNLLFNNYINKSNGGNINELNKYLYNLINNYKTRYISNIFDTSYQNKNYEYNNAFGTIDDPSYQNFNSFNLNSEFNNNNSNLNKSLVSLRDTSELCKIVLVGAYISSNFLVKSNTQYYKRYVDPTRASDSNSNRNNRSSSKDIDDDILDEDDDEDDNYDGSNIELENNNNRDNSINNSTNRRNRNNKDNSKDRKGNSRSTRSNRRNSELKRVNKSNSKPKTNEEGNKKGEFTLGYWLAITELVLIIKRLTITDKSQIYKNMVWLIEEGYVYLLNSGNNLPTGKSGLMFSKFNNNNRNTRSGSNKEGPYINNLMMLNNNIKFCLNVPDETIKPLIVELDINIQMFNF